MRVFVTDDAGPSEVAGVAGDPGDPGVAGGPGGCGVLAQARGEGRTARAREFERLRPLLFAIAFRITGSVAGAGDAVRETWLRYETAPARPGAPRAFLSAVVTRVAVDALRSARPRWERSHGVATLVLLERLSPLERAVFVLRDAFGFGFDEIAAAVERPPDACQQLVARAREHMAEGRPRS